MTPPPSSMVASFDWSRLERYCLPPYMPFEIIVHDYNMNVLGRVLDEGVYVSIFSSTAWQAFSSPQLMPLPRI